MSRRSTPGAGPTAPPLPDAVRAARFRPRSAALTLLTALVALLAFGWPLLWPATHAPVWLAAVVFLVSVPACVAMVAADLANHSLDVKALAMLGVLSAVVAVLRPLGAGTAGFETVFFLIILGGRVFGGGFGFVLGATSLLASAVLTGGFGVWLPYQMLSAALVGLGAGLLPRARGWLEIALLSMHAAVSAFVYGSLMDFSSWPFFSGGASSFGYDPHAGAVANLRHFAVWETVTALGWNLGRALSTIVLLVLLGRPLLHVLRRAARTARFTA